MIAVQVMGNDTAVGLAAPQGNFEPNVAYAGVYLQFSAVSKSACRWNRLFAKTACPNKGQPGTDGSGIFITR